MVLEKMSAATRSASVIARFRSRLPTGPPLLLLGTFGPNRMRAGYGANDAFVLWRQSAEGAVHPPRSGRQHEQRYTHPERRVPADAIAIPATGWRSLRRPDRGRAC